MAQYSHKPSKNPQRAQWAHFDQIDGHIVKELKGFFHKIPSGYIVDTCYVRIRPDPDVPREDEEASPADSYRLSTTERVPEETKSRTEEAKDGRSRAGGSERSEEPQTETRGEVSNISSEVVKYKYTKYIY